MIIDKTTIIRVIAIAHSDRQTGTTAVTHTGRQTDTTAVAHSGRQTQILTITQAE